MIEKYIYLNFYFGIEFNFKNNDFEPTQILNVTLNVSHIEDNQLLK